jgi:hypothetical protein
VIEMAKELTKPQEEALRILQEKGYLFAGNDVHKGQVIRINARTLDALERRGLIETNVGPDGGMYARRKETE